MPRKLLAKEILPCRCMRYTYARGGTNTLVQEQEMVYCLDHMPTPNLTDLYQGRSYIPEFEKLETQPSYLTILLGFSTVIFLMIIFIYGIYDTSKNPLDVKEKTQVEKYFPNLTPLQSDFATNH